MKVEKGVTFQHPVDNPIVQVAELNFVFSNGRKVFDLYVENVSWGSRLVHGKFKQALNDHLLEWLRTNFDESRHTTILREGDTLVISFREEVDRQRFVEGFPAQYLICKLSYEQD